MRALSTGIALEAHADAAYQSEVNTQIDPSAASYVQLGGYTTLNGSTTLSFGSQWRARLYGNNVKGLRRPGRFFNQPTIRATARSI